MDSSKVIEMVKERETCASFTEETLDVTTIDWNRVWAGRRAKRGESKGDKTFWNGRTAGFLKGASETGYADQFMALMNPDPTWTVFDMGCGTGTLAIPLAKKVREVIAVDFSPVMLAALRQRAQAAGLSNITAIEGQWEDDWSSLGITPCDCAVASRSLVGDDLRGSIEKLAAFATRRVCIVTVAGDGPFDRALFNAVGRPLHLGPDYIYNYNMLYSMGIEASIDFIREERNRFYESAEEAIEAMQWMFSDLTSMEEARLRAYLDGLTVQGEDGRPVIHHCTKVKWAVLWWDKENGMTSRNADCRFVDAPDTLVANCRIGK